MMLDNHPIIRQALIDWYQQSQRKLPWRETTDPYAIWVSEVMLQQTQVYTGLPYYLRWMQKYPTLRDLAKADLDEVLKMWEGLGYYARARNFHKAVNMVVDQFDGNVPNRFDEFITLPGVGDYIASAVMSIAFGHSHAVVDGNVKRVLSRLFLMDAPVNKPLSHLPFKDSATVLLGDANPSQFNQAVMELGALICKPKNPLCEECPVRQKCQAHQSGITAEYPKRVKTKPVPTHHIAVGVIVKDDQMLITQRKPDGLLGGLWEFPGGKVENRETAEAACCREILEETGLTVKVNSHLTRVKHAYTHFKIEMDVFICEWISGNIQLNSPVDYRWIRLEEMAQFAFPKANIKFMPLLKEFISEPSEF